MIYLRVHVVKPTFWHVEGVTTGLHHPSVPLSVQHTASSVRDHVLVFYRQGQGIVFC